MERVLCFIIGHYPDLINSFGLLLDIFGVWVLFNSEVPWRPSGAFLSGGDEVGREQKEEKRRKFSTKSGLIILTFGFAIQAVSNFI